MTHFARKLRYAANDGENGATFMALVELAYKKGGPPSGFVLFWRILRSPPMKCESKMIRLKAKSAEEAIEKFWLGSKKFPGWQSEEWKKTTPWLDRVAVGGSYEQFPPLTWVKVGTPNLWARRRKKRMPKFGDMGYALREYKARLRELEDRRWQLSMELPDFIGGDTSDEVEIPAAAVILDLIEELDKEILNVQNDIGSTETEMRFKVRQKFPNPIGKTPRREIRKQREREARCRAIW